MLGNFCSLQKDHESAVELFQRAIQLDPTFAYGYTLAGHEYFASEDYDKSLVSCCSVVCVGCLSVWWAAGVLTARQEPTGLAFTEGRWFDSL